MSGRLIFSVCLSVLLVCQSRAFAGQTDPPDVIAYDDGKLLNMDLSDNTLFAVRFTPATPFNLTTVYLMVLNDRSTTDGANVWVSENKGGLPAWPAISLGQIPPPLPDSTWIQYDLAGPIYFESDFFIIVQQKGSLFYPAYPSPSFWIGGDLGTTTHRTVKSSNNGQTWEPVGWDALIRAGGSYNSPPCTVSDPYPPAGARAIPTTTQLKWTPCPYAVGQDVYIGTDLDAVLTATRTSPLYKRQLPGTVTTYTSSVPLDPCIGYYWRIDTLPCPTCPPIEGPVQSFTTTCIKPACLPGDINADGIVDLRDLTILGRYWLQDSDVPCVPGTNTGEIDNCTPTDDELASPAAPDGYVYVGYDVVINYLLRESTIPLDYNESPDDISAIRSRTIVEDGVTVCDVIVRHLFKKEECAPTSEELTPPPAPEGYVYVGYTVVKNFSVTETTLPPDYTESPQDIAYINSHTVVRNGVTVCDVIVEHTYRKR